MKHIFSPQAKDILKKILSIERASTTHHDTSFISHDVDDVKRKQEIFYFILQRQQWQEEESNERMKKYYFPSTFHRHVHTHTHTQD